MPMHRTLYAFGFQSKIERQREIEDEKEEKTITKSNFHFSNAANVDFMDLKLRRVDGMHSVCTLYIPMN